MMHLKGFIQKNNICCNCSLFSNHNTDRVEGKKIQEKGHGNVGNKIYFLFGLNHYLKLKVHNDSGCNEKSAAGIKSFNVMIK